MTEQTPEKLPVGEVLESLTGYDEIAIDQKFGFDVYTIGKTKPLMMMRALAFVIERRRGATDAEAHVYALTLTVKEVNALVDDEEDDEFSPDDPITPAGNGGSDHVTEPIAWPISASEPV